MIVDFSFKNFRSFRDDAMLSMHAEHPKSNLLNNIAYPLANDVAVLRSAVIYGANASGKSNILLAIQALRWIINESHAFKEDRIISCYEPYRLSEESKNSPFEAEIEFIIPDGKRFIYAISYDRDKIISESLDYYPKRSKANIFSRGPDDTWETISFGGHYKGGSKRIPFFKNQSYLSKAGNSAAAPALIRKVYKYFSRIMSMSTSYELPIGDIYNHDLMLSLTADFLKRVDIGISGITREENDISKFGMFPSDIPDSVKQRFLTLNKYNFIFHRKDDSGKDIEFEQDDESEGTQKLFKMLPPILSTLKLGYILIIDELENSFHPHIAELIIRLFNDPEVNINNAQLIFTTHNIELMSPTLFRRDQIWFTKKSNGASNLYSLDEFDKSTVTSSSPYGSWYSDGRFGAIPDVKYKDICDYLSGSLGLRNNPEDQTQESSEEE